MELEQARAAFKNAEKANNESTIDEFVTGDKRQVTSDIITAKCDLCAPDMDIKFTAEKEYLLVVGQQPNGLPDYKICSDLGGIVHITPEFLSDYFTLATFKDGTKVTQTSE